MLLIVCSVAYCTVTCNVVWCCVVFSCCVARHDLGPNSLLIAVPSDNASDFLRDPRMINSTRLWRDDNLQAFENEVDDWEKRSASQFICLYGVGVPGATKYVLTHSLSKHSRISVYL